MQPLVLYKASSNCEYILIEAWIPGTWHQGIVHLSNQPGIFHLNESSSFPLTVTGV